MPSICTVSRGVLLFCLACVGVCITVTVRILVDSFHMEVMCLVVWWLRAAVFCEVVLLAARDITGAAFGWAGGPVESGYSPPQEKH